MPREFADRTQTTLSNEDVIVRAIQFFTSENWRVQTQSPKVVTFVGRPRIMGKIIASIVLASIGVLVFIPIGSLLTSTIIGAIIGIPIFLIGVAMFIGAVIVAITARYRQIQFQNLVLTAESHGSRTEVAVNYPEYARMLVSRFLDLLPSGKFSTDEKTLANMDKLSEAEFDLVRSFMVRRNSIEKDARLALAKKIAKILIKKLELQSELVDGREEEFLEEVAQTFRE